MSVPRFAVVVLCGVGLMALGFVMIGTPRRGPATCAVIGGALILGGPGCSAGR